MSLQLGEIAPTLLHRQRQVTFPYMHIWAMAGFAFFTSKRFTPVCTTEVGLSPASPKFEERNCKVLALSVDSVEDYQAWILISTVLKVPR